VSFVALASALPAGAADHGRFVSSDPLLNRIWAASVRTATDMVAPGPLWGDALDRPCRMEVKVVILDGVDRDRCPYIGDQAVVGKTLLLASAANRSAIRSTIVWFARHQHADGAIPASPLNLGAQVLFDYNAFWVETLYDYVLRTGDRAVVRKVWPQLVSLMDGWYADHLGPQGLLVNDLGPSDYGYIRRTGTTVAYYNAGYVRALRMAAGLASWVGQPAYAAAWRGRVAQVAAAFGDAFWDAEAGAFRDATVGPVVHPEDGNAFAVLAGLATPDQAASALRFLERELWRPYGSTIADDDVWDDPGRWGTDASQRVYPFMSYFEVMARYAAGLDASALELIRREWGYMLSNGRGSTMWETIGPDGGPPFDPTGPSWSHGWSSGAAPALTEYVLGVMPTTPGYATAAVHPHVADLAWARGDVPTPRGRIQVEWAWVRGRLSATVASPAPVTLTLPAVGRTVLDGSPVRAQVGQTTLKLRAGTHTVVVG
jgi:hypothetical protein